MLRRIAVLTSRTALLATMALRLPEARAAKTAPPAALPLLYVSDAGSEGQMHLVTLDPVSGQPKRLTRGAEIEMEGTRSPDGRQIVCTRIADAARSTPAIVLLNADGTEQKRLVTSAPDTMSFGPCWSPDGRQIAYSVLNK